MNENVRPFEELIEEIEVEGERVVPLEKIAELCFNYNNKAVKNEARKWVNQSYDHAAWYTFETNILKPERHFCSIGIFRSFDIWASMRVGEEKKDQNIYHCNQVEIIKLLIKWGFIPLN